MDSQAACNDTLYHYGGSASLAAKVCSMCLPVPRPRAADLAGITLSLACLIHCLGLPMLLMLVPVMSRWLSLPEGVHAAILLLALPAAAAAMVQGWRRHRRPLPSVMAVTGLALLTLGLAAHESWIVTSDPAATDRLLTSIGAIGLAAAHLLNWRWLHHGGQA